MFSAYPSLRTIEDQHGFEPLEVEGKIPEDLAGTLYRVGVGKFEAHGMRHKHWFDGDGGVAAIRMQNSQAEGAYRVLDCEPDIEREKKEFLLGRFGRAPKGIMRRLMSVSDRDMFVNSANTSILQWRNRCFALYEASAPTEFDPESLERIGDTDFGRVIRRAFSAHPKYVPSRQAYYNFGFRFLPRPVLDLYCLRDDGMVSWLGAVPFSGASFAHDFIATDNYLVFVIGPVFNDPFEMLIKGMSVSRTFHWKPQLGTEVLIVPIDDPKKHVKIQIDPLFVTHFINGFEREGKIIVDAIVYPDASDLRRIASVITGELDHESNQGTARRFEIDVVKKRVDRSLLSDVICEVPQIAPHMRVSPYEWTYVAGYRSQASERNELYDALYKMNVRNGKSYKVDFGEGQTVSEAIFVQSSSAMEEDDGYLLSLNYDNQTDRSYLAILEAKNPSDNLVGKVWFEHPIPFTFHGLWCSNPLE